MTLINCQHLLLLNLSCLLSLVLEQIETDLMEYRVMVKIKLKMSLVMTLSLQENLKQQHWVQDGLVCQ